MNRKSFIQSQGATCKNWSWSWSFVNHKDRFVIFGEWDVNVRNDGAVLILDKEWKTGRTGGQSKSYKESREHIRLIEEEGYQLKTYPMVFSDEKQDREGNGPAKIKHFEPYLTTKRLVRKEDSWFSTQAITEHKVARLCWNTERWQKPSGKLGKSKNKDLFEFRYGFGHEEWLFDTSKLIQGYHYAYIQPIGSHRDIYNAREFNISFYSIDSESNQRWWIGRINNVQIIDEEEALAVFEQYQKLGWYEEMIAQLEQVGASVEGFRNFSAPTSFAVLKYKPEDLELLDEPLEFQKDDPAVKSDYYNLKNLVQEPELSRIREFIFAPGHNPKKGKSISSYQERKRENNLLHNRIQSALFKELAKIYGEGNVGTENPTGTGTLIDVVIRHSDGYCFYEIKTSPTLKQCIRDALGQLLEYAYYGNSVQIREFVIVSPNKMTNACFGYISLLRKEYKIPIRYQRFDVETMSLDQELH